MAKYDFNTPAPYAEGFADGQKDMLDKACQWWTDYLVGPQYSEEDREAATKAVEAFKKDMTL